MTVAALSNLLATSDPKPSLIGQKVRGRYLVQSRIGAGTFGSVYKVIDLELSNMVGGYVCRAIKVIDVADPEPPRIPPPGYVNRRLHHAMREIYYHQLVSSHPNIVTLHEYFLIANREEMFLVLDHCAGGDLGTYINEKGNPFAGDDRRTREIILQICGAVDFIHSKGVFHKDLKPQNILISRDGRKVFLCDFGLSADTQTSTCGGGTKAYMSPGKGSHLMCDVRLLTRTAELLDRQGFYCPQRADAWTLGIILLNMLGFWPWDSATLHSRRFVRFMCSDDYLLRTRFISPGANDIIRDILRFHPELRLSVPEIAARVLQLHSFFDNPRIGSTVRELHGMKSMYRRMLTRADPVAWRRKKLEYLRDLDKISAFNDLTGQLPLPRPQPKIRVPHSPENPPPRTYRPHCAPIPDVPPPTSTDSPGEPTRKRNRRWRFNWYP